ncbi:hypothetical protein HK102_009834 [Quaeritorhiza haematococci]|nr:hypothetical protein HK102_009834 [Quaeritorhiza haematococci]
MSVPKSQHFCLKDLIGGGGVECDTVSPFKLSNKRSWVSSMKQRTTVDPQPIKFQNLDVDTCHSKKMKYFQTLQDQLPEHESRLAKATRDADRVALAHKIEAIRNRKEETEYLLQTSDILYKYWTRENNHTTTENEPENEDEPLGLDGIVWTSANQKEKDRLRAEYFRAIGVEHSPSQHPQQANEDMSFCSACGGCVLLNGGYFVCEDCGVACDDACNDFQVSFKESQGLTYKPHFSYKKINHFSEWLASIQGKENTVIPEMVVQAIKAEIKKEQSRT